MSAKTYLFPMCLGVALLMFLIRSNAAQPLSPPTPLNHAATEVHLHDHTTSIIDTGGPGVPVVLIHSLATDHRMWAEVIAGLASTRRVIAYDFRGHGAAAEAPRPYSVSLLASDLHELLDYLKISQAHVYGISMGGAIAQQFAVDHPDRVASLALIATFSKGQIAFAQRGLSGILDGMPAQIPPTLTRWFTPAALAVNGPGVQYARASVANVQPDNWLASWNAISNIDFFPKLGAIRVPVKVIAGELDLSCPPDLMKTGIADQIPNSQFFVVAGAAHMLSLEKTGELLKFLRLEN